MKIKLSTKDKRLENIVNRLVRIKCLPILEENYKLKKENIDLKRLVLELCYNENSEIILKMNDCNSKFPNQCRCAFRCLENSFCDKAEEKINSLKTTIKYLKTVINNTNDIMEIKFKEVLNNG